MVLVQIYQLKTANTLLSNAYKLAKQLGKEFGILYFDETDNELKSTLNNLGITDSKIYLRNFNDISLSDFSDEVDISFLFIQLTDNKSKSIKYVLNLCRDLRIPYILHKDSFSELKMEKVILPIGFLEEEMEKAQFASAFGRFCGSKIKMLLANDYGSKAATNAERMKELFDKFDFSYNLEKAKKDSFKVEMEAVEVAQNEQAGCIIVSSSRDYGLDDIIFGSKESHVVKKSTVPVLLVNPRGDLYALCD